jgi:antitoxin HicB
MPATTTKTNPLIARSAVGIKKTLSQTMRREMASRKISVSEMAKAIGTGRTSVRRILDAKNTSITLETMTRAAGALGLEVALTARKLSPSELGGLAAQLPGASRSKSAALRKKILTGFYA